MRTVSMTEFNQHPSRIAKLASKGDVVVLRRGKAVLRITSVEDAGNEDPLDRLIRNGTATPPRRANSPTAPLPSIDTSIDLVAMLEADRGRLSD